MDHDVDLIGPYGNSQRALDHIEALVHQRPESMVILRPMRHVG